MANSKLEVSSLEWQRDEDSNALVSVDRNELCASVCSPQAREQYGVLFVFGFLV